MEAKFYYDELNIFFQNFPKFGNNVWTNGNPEHFKHNKKCLRMKFQI